MRKTIRKWFWAWDFDKEEQWLNEMGCKGMALVAVDYGKYTFEPCTPGAYHIRLELLENLPTHAESQQYIDFLEDTGAEYLGSIMRWVYFRGKTDNGEFNLYSDRDSRLQHLNRLLMLIGVFGIVCIGFGLGSLFLYFSMGVLLNLVTALLDMGVGLLLASGFFQIFLKKRKLQREQILFS